MSSTSDPALIICDGSLAGLVACWMETVARAESSLEGGALRSAAWMTIDDRPARGRREAALKKHVQMCGLGGVLTGQAVMVDATVLRQGPKAEPTGAHASTHAGLNSTAMLLSAAVQAIALGLGRVVWPVHWAGLSEPDLDWLADVTDRAMLVGQLASIDVPRVVEGGAQGGKSVRIETPFADFDDAEVMELALDMDVPLGAAWWCQREDERPCGACAECVRWRAALEQVDPQGLVHVAGVR